MRCMIMNEENSPTKNRDLLLRYLLDNNASGNIILQIVTPLADRTDEEKEIIAEKLFNAIKDKETSEEMLEAAKALKL